MDCGWNLFTKEGVLHLRLDLFPLSFCSRLVFSFRIRMIAKGNISSWEHLPSVDHLNFTFFRIIIWKLFQSRLLVLNARKYCQFCTKKMVNHFSESLTFTSAMIYQNEVRTKHLRMLICYSAIDNLRRSDEQSFYSGRAHLLKTRDNALSKKIIHHLISLLNNHFLRFFFRLLVTAFNEKYFCLESACQVAIT